VGGVAGLADPLVAFELAVFLVTAPAACHVFGVFSLDFHIILQKLVAVVLPRCVTAANPRNLPKPSSGSCICLAARDARMT
jgi:hypothetical protein